MESEKDSILMKNADKKGGINPGKVPPRPNTPPPCASTKIMSEKRIRERLECFEFTTKNMWEMLEKMYKPEGENSELVYELYITCREYDARISEMKIMLGDD